MLHYRPRRNTPQYLLAAAGLLLAALALSVGCGADPAPSAQPVDLTTADGVRLSGTLWESDGAHTAVILSHQGTVGASQETWQPFARKATEQGTTVLTFDFRGWGGSDGEFAHAVLETDLEAAVDFLSSRGYENIVAMGACMGGAASMMLASRDMVDGVALVGSGLGTGAKSLSLEQLAAVRVPKLFVCTEDDTVEGRKTYFATMNQRMYDVSREPKKLVLLSGAAHGTDIFTTDQGPELERLLLDFLRDFEP